MINKYAIAMACHAKYVWNKPHFWVALMTLKIRPLVVFRYYTQTHCKLFHTNFSNEKNCVKCSKEKDIEWQDRFDGDISLDSSNSQLSTQAFVSMLF